MSEVNDSDRGRDARAIALDEVRYGFPEPTLLPHLARSLPFRQLPMLLDAVEATGAGRGALPPWPRLVAATCAIVARRIDDAPDIETVLTLLEHHTALYSHLGAPVLDAAIQIVTPAADDWAAAERAERICRLAARHPDHNGGVLVDLASAALLDLRPEQALNASAWFLPLTDGAERRAIIDAWLESDWFDLDALTALFAVADHNERDQLTTMLLAFLASRVPPAGAVAAIATVLPTLSDAGRSEARIQLSNAMTSVAADMPPWWLALVLSRVGAIDVSVGLDFNTVEPAWRTWLESFGPLPPQTGYTDVMRAHPGAIGWMASEGYPGLSPDEAGSLLDEIFSRWGGMEMAMAPSGEDATVVPDAPPAAEDPVSPPVVPPVPAPAPPAAPTLPKRRSGRFGGITEGLGGLLGGLFGRRSTRYDGTPSARRGLPPDAPAQPQPDRRLQADVALVVNNLVGGAPQTLTHAFAAGRRHNVDLSVGRGASLRLNAGFHEPVFAENSDVEALDLRLIYNDIVTGDTVDLPRDTSRDSSVWQASLDVPMDADRVDATVVVLHKGRVLQAAKLSGSVVPTIEAAASTDSEITFTVTADVHDFTNLDDRGTFDASVVTDGESSAAFAGAAIGVRDLRGVDNTIRKLTDKLFKSSEAVAMAGAGGDPAQYEKLLVYLATHGKLLHSVLIRQLMPSLDSARRIQIVSTNPSAILPLEFVYSGPSPTHTAKLCDGWKEALEKGTCPSCEQQPTDERSRTICPLHFWALSKVIERHAPGQPRPDGHDFFVDTRVAGKRDRLAPLKHALFAASDNVPEDLVDATLAVLNSTVSTCEDARTWAEWTASVKKNSPTLLVSMPHNALDPVLEINTLEIGGGSELRAGEVTRKFVCRDDAQVGPVVLLLGCQTAHGGPQPFHTFVGEFRNNGAAIVIGTLATVLGEHAAPVVQATIHELAKPADPSENTFGDLLLRIRRQMFAQGILIALAVAAFGDADWALAAPGD